MSMEWLLQQTWIQQQQQQRVCVGGLGVIIESNLNQVRLSCCWVSVGWVVTIFLNPSLSSSQGLKSNRKYSQY